MSQISVDGKLYECEPEDSVLTFLRRHELPVTSACGGKGTCHLCRVKVIKAAASLAEPTAAERKGLGNMRLAQGFRLACQIKPRDVLELEASEYRHRPTRSMKKKLLKKDEPA
jgi:ferredoxin